MSRAECCRYCGLTFENLSTSQRANHTRWCDLNPNRQKYNKDLKKARESRTKNSFDAISRKAKQNHAAGKYAHIDWQNINVGRKHSEDNKLKIKMAALNSDHRRLVRSIRSYICVDGSIVKLDSSWEEYFASLLDKHLVLWSRPENPLKWIDSYGIVRNYFPDFYLPEFDLFIDPKNPYAYKNQQEKCEWIKTNIKNVVFLHSKEEMDNFVISSLLNKF